VKLYCATGNAGKLHEFQLAAAEFHVELEALPRFREIPPCEEYGSTFEENAVRKATWYAPHAPGPLFADDSGLEVDALGGGPGVYSARYAGENATDEANNRLLLDRLAGETNRMARFVCVIAVARGAELLGTFRSTVEGLILEEARGSQGFGYDPLFYYEEFGCSFGQVSREHKMTVSHRGKALRAMLSWFTCNALPPPA
jgi:XTP/dITP diphosphohydrolase